jgi:hypothetical protein
MMDRTVYLRAYVRNKGRSSAEKVHVALLQIAVWSESREKWEEYKHELEGREFVWSNSDPESSVRQLAGGSARPLEIFSFPRDKPEKGHRPVTLRLGGTLPASETHILHPPGAWRLTLELSAEGAKTTAWHLSFRYDGGWPRHHGLNEPGETLWDHLHVVGPSKRPQKQPPPAFANEAQTTTTPSPHERSLTPGLPGV